MRLAVVQRRANIGVGRCCRNDRLGFIASGRLQGPLGALDLEVGQEPVEPLRDPPVAVAEQLHGGRDDHHAHERGVEQDGERRARGRTA